MTSLSVYCVGAVLGRSMTDNLPAVCTGAYVPIYLVSTDIVTAIEEARAQCREDGYRLQYIESAFLVDLEGYDRMAEPDPDHAPEYEDLMDLFERRSVFYGGFDVYEDHVSNTEMLH